MQLTNPKPEDPTSFLAKYKLTEQIIKAATQCESFSQIMELNLTGNSKVLRYRLRYIAGKIYISSYLRPF